MLELNDPLQYSIYNCSTRGSTRNEDLPDKPYELVSFPRRSPSLNAPAGHHRYKPKGYHGKLKLSLQVKTSLHVSTGITAMGNDVGSRVPLIKTMTQGKRDRLVIQGSSLKGCMRAIYESITNSTLGVVTNYHKDIKKSYKKIIPQDRWPCEKKRSFALRAKYLAL